MSSVFTECQSLVTLCQTKQNIVNIMVPCHGTVIGLADWYYANEFTGVLILRISLFLLVRMLHCATNIFTMMGDIVRAQSKFDHSSMQFLLIIIFFSVTVAIEEVKRSNLWRWVSD